jgi:5-methylcytosine-specific restriction endonuclease McrA
MPFKDLETQRAYMREYKRKRRQTPKGQAEHRAEEASRYARRGDHIRNTTRAYRMANPDKCRAWTAAKIARNPEANRLSKNAMSQRRRAQSAAFDKADFVGALLTSDGICAYCLRPSNRLEVDHVIPLSRGGSCDVNNLVAACARCNRRKSAKTALEWVFGLRLAP